MCHVVESDFNKKIEKMKKLLGTAIICTALLSCQKEAVIEGEPSLTGINNIKGALTSADWVLNHTALIYNPDLVDNADVENCKKDDIYRFKLNGDADIQFGNFSCSAGPLPQPTSGIYGAWELQSDGGILKQTVTRDVPGFINGEIIYWTVDYITLQKMRIKRVVSEPGKTYTQADTYIRK
jgi:hypothetical protein